MPLLFLNTENNTLKQIGITLKSWSEALVGLWITFFPSSLNQKPKFLHNFEDLLGKRVEHFQMQRPLFYNEDIKNDCVFSFMWLFPQVSVFQRQKRRWMMHVSVTVSYDRNKLFSFNNLCWIFTCTKLLLHSHLPFSLAHSLSLPFSVWVNCKICPSIYSVY